MRNIAIMAVLTLAIGGGIAYYVIQHNKAKKHPHVPVDPNAFKVALVTPGAQDDGGWSEAAKRGLDLVAKDLKATTFSRVATNSADAHAAFRNYAGDRHADIVIGHASEWNDEKTQEIAKDYPKTIFLIAGSENSKDNICAVRFTLEDGTYVLGQLAASMTKSGTLGCVGPEKRPVIASTFFAFAEGAKSIKPDIKIRVLWTENSADIVRAKEQTLQLINEGADFIFHNANNGAKGVFEAVQEQKAKGVYVFGSNDDQALTLPQYDDVILASAALDVPNTYLTLCRKIKDKTFKPETQWVGIADNAVTVAFNKKLEGKIPPDVRKKIDETVAKLKSGELKAPRGELK
jgi:basic membrane lipoprotein Med (substrate-binding protein (PBP1-ABC) superfamily)